MVAVTLRPIVASDSSRIHEWASSPVACRYQPWGPNEVPDTEAFVADAIRAWSDGHQARRVWVAEMPDLGVVGLGELKVHSRVHMQAEIAYAIHMELWGRGYGAAIAEALIAIAREEDMHRIFATCDPRNVGSARVLQKVGMSHEGTLRHTLQIRDGWRDSDMYALLSDGR